MLIELEDGKVLKNCSPIGFCTGYRAKRLEMEPWDLAKLAHLAKQNPDKAYAVLLQLDARINRPDMKTGEDKT